MTGVRTEARVASTRGRRAAAAFRRGAAGPVACTHTRPSAPTTQSQADGDARPAVSGTPEPDDTPRKPLSCFATGLLSRCRVPGLRVWSVPRVCCVRRAGCVVAVAVGVRSHRAPQCRAVDVTGCAAKLGGKEGGREAPEAELEKGVLQSALGQTRRALASPGPAAECAFCARASEVTHILLPTKGSIRREQTQDAGAKTGNPTRRPNRENAGTNELQLR